MSRDQVVATESSPILSERTINGQLEVVYRTTLRGYLGTIEYFLEDDQLVAAAYSFTSDSRGELFAYLTTMLTSMYGKPSFQTDNLIGWRMNRTEIALALVSGKICHVSYWEKSYFAKINDLVSQTSTP
jgi:hypothetical protein